MDFQVGQIVRLNPNGHKDSIYNRLLSEGPIFIVTHIHDEFLDIAPTTRPRRIFDSFYVSRFIPATQHVYRRH